MVIGEYEGFTNLHVGHESGLDVMSTSKKLIFEIKNQHKTDNASSRKANLDKLVKFQKMNPEFKCFYGIINDRVQEGCAKKIVHDGVDVEYLSGDKLFTFIFGENKDIVIKTVKEYVQQCRQSLV